MSVNPLAVAKAMAARAHDLGLVHYAPTAPAPANLTIPLVVFGDLPPSPVRAVSVRVYNVAPERESHMLQVTNPLVFVQWRFREPGDDGANAVWNRSHLFFEQMHSESPGPWPGGVAPAWCYRIVNAPADFENGTWSKPDSYEIRYNPGE